MKDEEVIKRRAIQLIKDLETELFFEANKKRRSEEYQKLSVQAKILRKAMDRLQENL